ncbi:hypothetical protein D6C77_00526 [Aureobasidium pullulans]|nr:hypothetical protein D6C97_05252 [Aureobasidium pullulans]TIA65854.1 hypothetical protein D6C77_00526 [Aureobasidium pullulans]
MPPDLGSSATTATQRQGANSEETPTPSRFLDLPTEIRLMILKYALTDGTQASTVELIRGRRSRITSTYLDAVPFHSFSTKPSVQILLTNRQINAEGTPILYSKNTFSTCPSALERFTKAVGAANRQYIRSIHINGATMELYFTSKWLRSLKEYIGLKRLRLNMLSRVYYLKQRAIRSDYRPPGMSVLLTLIPVIKMLCEREGSDEAARKIIEVLPYETSCHHNSYLWTANPCIDCCNDARFFEEYKVVEDDFWSDIPKRYAEAKESARREKWKAKRFGEFI